MPAPERRRKLTLSPRQLLYPPCVGFSAFAAILVVGMAITRIVAKVIIPAPAPNATEAYETIGGLGEAMLCLYIGGGLSILIGIFAGIYTSVRVAEGMANSNSQ